MFQNKKYILMTASMGLGLESVSGASRWTRASAWGRGLVCHFRHTPEGQENPRDVQLAVDEIADETITKQVLDGMKEPYDTESSIAIKVNYIAWRNFLALYQSKFLSQQQKDHLENENNALKELKNRMEYSWKFRCLFNEVFCDKPDASLLGAFIRLTYEDLSEACKEHIFQHIYRSTHFDDVLNCLPRFEKLKSLRESIAPSYEKIMEALIQDLIQFYRPCEYSNLQTVAKAFMAERSEILRLVRQEYNHDLRDVWILLNYKILNPKLYRKDFPHEIDFWSGDMFTPEEQTKLVYARRFEHNLKDLFWILSDGRRWDSYTENEKEHLNHSYDSYTAHKKNILSGLRGIQYGGDEWHTLELGQTEESRTLGPVDDLNLSRSVPLSAAECDCEVNSTGCW